MSDPINRPLPREDEMYGDVGPQIPNGADPKEEKIAAIERQKNRERNELSLVLGTEAGQSVVMRILARCGVYGATFSASHAAASFNDGRRDIGLWLLSDIQKLDPEAYPNLLIAHARRLRALGAGEAGIAEAKRRS